MSGLEQVLGALLCENKEEVLSMMSCLSSESPSCVACTKSVSYQKAAGQSGGGRDEECTVDYEGHRASMFLLQHSLLWCVGLLLPGSQHSSRAAGTS